MRLIDADQLLAELWFIEYHPYKSNGSLVDCDKVVEDVIKQCKLYVKNAPTATEPKKYEGQYKEGFDDGYDKGYNRGKQDHEPKQGKWKTDKDGYGICPCCGSKALWNYNRVQQLTNYCPECGAKMR